jgi:hypothetical protein
MVTSPRVSLAVEDDMLDLLAIAFGNIRLGNRERRNRWSSLIPK